MSADQWRPLSQAEEEAEEDTHTCFRHVCLPSLLCVEPAWIIGER